jgi:hypothetical protein
MIAAAESQSIDVAAVGSVPFVIGLSHGVANQSLAVTM